MPTIRILLIGFSIFCGNGIFARSVFLNGVDISSAVNQKVNGADIIINAKGDVFITAPHYKVNEEEHYIPLAKHLKQTRPEHKKAAKMPKNLSHLGHTRPVKSKTPEAPPPKEEPASELKDEAAP